MAKILVVFDFDYTIVDGDYDKSLLKLLPVPLPEEVQQIKSKDSHWSEYMCGLFDFLHQHQISPEQIKETVVKASLNHGMKELFDHLNQEVYEVIVISDSNMLFIDWSLTGHGLRQYIDYVYANPAELSKDGKLVMRFYHQQDWCDMSTKNLCKG